MEVLDHVVSILELCILMERFAFFLLSWIRTNRVHSLHRRALARESRRN